MEGTIGRQRTEQAPHVLNAHMNELARRYGARMPRSQTDGICGPKHVKTPHGRGGPYVKAEPLRRLLRPLVEREGLGRVAWWAGTSERSLFRVMHVNALVTVALADDLICGGLGDPSLWATTPGLDYVDWAGRPV